MNEIINAAQAMTRYSDDPEIQVVAAARTMDGKIVAGVNRFPAGLRGKGREFIEKHICHAERDLIYTAAKQGVKLLGSTMYCSLYPCSQCAQAIVGAGVLILFTHEKPDMPNWNDDWLLAEKILQAGTVEVRKIA